jgi:ribosome modulation factor
MSEPKKETIERLNLAQLEAAKREGFKDGFNAGKRAAAEQAYTQGYAAGVSSGKAFMLAIRCGAVKRP